MRWHQNIRDIRGVHVFSQGNSYIKRSGVFVGNFEKNPLRNTNILFCEGSILKQNIFCGSIPTRCGVLKAGYPESWQTCFFQPRKGATSIPLFLSGSDPLPWAWSLIFSLASIKKTCSAPTAGIQQLYSKGPGKRGHIVADTLLPTQMLPRLPARATFVVDTNFVSGTRKMFLILFRNILCPQQMFPSLRSP